MQSSSSSATEPGPEGFAGFLSASLAAIARDLPWIHARLCATLAPREVLLTIDGEEVAVAAALDALHLLPAPRAPSVHVVASGRAILDLVDARATLASAVWDGSVVLRGAVPDLVAFHDGLLIYLHGAVRGPSFPALLHRFRRTYARERSPR